MNEEGKSSLKFQSVCFFIVLCFYMMVPAYSLNGGDMPLDLYSETFSKEFSVFFILCLYALLGYFLCYILSSVWCYVIYFIQRQWCLHKFRKPVMIYKGTDN